jgi:hypothetical protein
LIALALLRKVDLERSIAGRKIVLHFVRNTDGQEIDFALVENQKVPYLIEV